MQKTKKRPPLLFLLLGAMLSGYFGYLMNGAWKKGMDINTFFENFSAVCKEPLADYLNTNTTKAVAIASAIYVLAVLMYYTSRRNYMPGKEYGTARFAHIRQVNRLLADKEEGYNRILSQNVRMSLDTRYTKLNNNVLIIGGSGAGKTFYEVKPNLMQMPRSCSFICTDPKGGARRSRLKRAGIA